MSFFQTLSVLGSLAATVSAHGYVSGVVVAGTYYEGYSPSFQYKSPPPTVIGWSDPDNLSNGYVAPAAFADPDIICHLSATPGGTSAKVAAGETVELQWTTWPESHHGPVIDYLAKCSGDCSEVDKTTLEFFKISQSGLIDGSTAPGKWASDDLIANNNSWAVTVPPGIAAGNYVLRHEIIALHSAGDPNGAQNYPQCINLEITSDGSDTPAGTLGTALYKDDDAGIKINIYTSLASYEIPGPSLYNGAASAASQTAVSVTSDAPVETGSSTSYVAASTTIAVSSGATTTSIAWASHANSSSYAAATSTAASPTADAEATSAPSSTYVESAGAGTTVTSECTTTVYATVTAYDGEETAVSVTAAPESAIASIIAAVPSEALTSTIPTTIVAPETASPTSYSSRGSGAHWGSKPAKALPEGWTLKDLLQWVAYLVKNRWSEKRNHARDFSIEQATTYREYVPKALPYEA